MAEEIVVRPSLRRAKFGLALALVAVLLVVGVYFVFRSQLAWWFLFLILVPLVPPFVGWLDQKRTTLTVSGSTARYDRGFFSTKSRVVALSSIAEVKVEKSLTQRMWGIGTLLLEIPGREGRVVIQDVDQPAKAAEKILAMKAASAAGPETRSIPNE